MLETNPQLLEENRFDPIVTLTPEQEKEAVEKYPSYFKTEEELPPFPYVDRPQKRNNPAFGLQVCQPEVKWETLYLALNFAGKLVQVLQVKAE